MDAEAPEPSEAPLVAGYLEEWLEVQRTQVQPSTWSSYRGNVDRYLTPNLGELRLDEITVARLNHLYSVLLRITLPATSSVRLECCGREPPAYPHGLTDPDMVRSSRGYRNITNPR